MKKLKLWLESITFKARTGFNTVNLGEASETIIRYKDIYISVLEGENGWHVGYFDSCPTHVALKDIKVAVSPSEVK